MKLNVYNEPLKGVVGHRDVSVEHVENDLEVVVELDVSEKMDPVSCSILRRWERATHLQNDNLWQMEEGKGCVESDACPLRQFEKGEELGGVTCVWRTDWRGTRKGCNIRSQVLNWCNCSRGVFC